ncbi:hypothetical protein B1992_12650 [Pseudoxanthomonas broegbernensis]|uniref:DUF4124 domain-containing protein n=1 Tax=Pseudoxanthomonas broegbernensis TaxID=83619 RepID=A0A7V8GKQ2_9GAMM|nr:hypothetical protein B1992_12650 [Pseudoxanthomonas broegbernensis]
MPRLLPVLLLLPALSSLPSHARAAEPAAPTGVTIYRCADSRGQLVALRDSPCLPGERQEVLQMQRPQDPPPRPAPPEPAAASPLPPPREVRVIAVQPPQPMYECTTPEGERYTSEDGQGHPRWVPFWTLGYGYPARPGPRPPDTGPGVHPPGPPPGVAPGGHRPGGPPHPGHAVVAPAGGAWIRDACVRLSQDEICTHLSDRRYEILRLYHAAMPSQRHALDREQRQIDARMGNDCPGY